MTRILMIALAMSIVGCGRAPNVREEKVSLESISPQQKHRISIVDFPDEWDRNFELRITDLSTGATRTVFKSPDEGGAGTDRLIWSKDGARFIIVGREFGTDTRARMATGEDLYLMYELSTGKILCNATQQSNPQYFGKAEIAPIEWQETIELRAAAGADSSAR